MSSTPPPEGSATTLRDTLGRISATALSALHTRAELATVEFVEERDRSLARLTLVLIGAVAFTFALLAATTLLVVVFWDDHRLAVLAVVTLVYGLIGALAMWRLAERRRLEPTPFEQTLAELERDRAWLTRRFEGKR